MKFVSTNRKSPMVTLREAVMNGLAPDGGLYMPEDVPSISKDFFKNLHSYSFQKIAFEISKQWIEDEIPEADLKKMIEDAFDFDAPLVRLSDSLHILELFHGPTLAFKDFGARFMARLMGYFLNVCRGAPRRAPTDITILVATSGDTGSAVAQGFYNVPGIRVVLLYPSGGVSEIQEKQLTTLGGNVTALEIKGVFDDCQRMVKEAFADAELREKIPLSSANSINIARLIPQSFYYFRAYAQLKGPSNPVVFSVPSGNFGNLTAGLIAKKMGLPIHRFIAATNANDIAPSYLKTGHFEPRPSQKTISNAMDVGNPSNFARIQSLYHGDLSAIRADIVGYSFSDDETRHAIREVYDEHGYVLDPHAAVGVLGMRQFAKENLGDFDGIVLGTAHPAKFLDIVEPIIKKTIEMPERLKKSLSEEKKSWLLSNRYEDLKGFLMN